MSRTGICYIVGAMPLEPELALSPAPGDLVIAADGGYAALQDLGILPDLVVGDFDSLGHVPNHPNVELLPCVKDDTDMGHALDHALSLGYTRFVLLGGMGGRLDHTVANLQLLGHIAHRGGRGLLLGQGQVACAIHNDTLTFPPSLTGYCSVFCQSGTAHGVTLEGLKYTLDKADLTETFPLGVSNEFIGVPARVTVENGTLLLIWQTAGPIADQLPCLL